MGLMAGGQVVITLYADVHEVSKLPKLLLFFFAGFQFLSYSVTLSAESVNESTPAVRVTWRTAVPPECVASVRVVFRRSGLGSVTSYTTTNTSGTQVIQSPLQCGTEYYASVLVVAVQRLGGVQEQSMQKRVVVGGKENGVCKFSLAIPNQAVIFGLLFLPFLPMQCLWVGDENYRTTINFMKLPSCIQCPLLS